jgi:hypothetical protein
MNVIRHYFRRFGFGTAKNNNPNTFSPAKPLKQTELNYEKTTSDVEVGLGLETACK